MTVRELLDRLTSREIAEWRAYFRVVAMEQEMEMAKANIRRR